MICVRDLIIATSSRSEASSSCVKENNLSAYSYHHINQALNLDACRQHMLLSLKDGFLSQQLSKTKTNRSNPALYLDILAVMLERRHLSLQLKVVRTRVRKLALKVIQGLRQ